MLTTWVFWAMISKSCNRTKVYSTNVSKSKTSATLSRYLGLPLHTITKLAHSTCTKLGTSKNLGNITVSQTDERVARHWDPELSCQKMTAQQPKPRRN